MDKVVLQNITESCREELASLSIGTGLYQLKMIVRYCSDSRIISEVEELEDNYRSMLLFLFNGGKDQDRSLTQNRICQKALEILCVANRDIRLQKPDNQYTKAYHELLSRYGSKTEEALLEKWTTNLLPDEQILLQDYLFSLIWTSPKWSQKQTAYWYEFLSRQTDLVRIHFMGAVILSLWEYFDTEKMEFLFLYTDTDNKKLNSLTITALVLLAEKYRLELSFLPDLQKRYSESNVGKYVAEVVKENLHMRQTLLAIREEEKIMSDFSLSLPPEEMDKLMRKKLDHIRFMVEKGLDVNLSNRTELWYQCDFLRENISHWWWPFEKTSPVIEEFLVDKEGKFNKLAYQMTELPSECDIDRYAIFSFMAKSQYKSRFMEQMIQSLNLNDANHEVNIILHTNHFQITMQNLYRIFVHSPLKGEIDNPFSLSWTYKFWQNSIFQDYLSEEKAIELCSEMIDTRIYDMPLLWLEELTQTSGTSQEMLRIQSECHYSLDNYPEAIASLSQMLLFDEKDEWALMHIQKCYDKIERTDLQLEYLNKLLAIKPEDVSYLGTTAAALCRAKQYNKALEHLFHLDILKPEDPDIMLSIVSCATRLRKFDVALRYNNAILATGYKKKYLVYLNAGNINFLMGDWKKAVYNYKQFLDGTRDRDNTEKMQKDSDDEFYANTLILEEMGISSSDIQLMRDMIQL